MYSRLELIKQAIDLRHEADKNMRLAERRYKKNYDQRIRFTPIFRVGDFVFLDKPPLFRSAEIRFNTEVYSKRLRRVQGPYKVTSVDDNTLQILQNGLGNTISIYQATLSLTSYLHCHDDLADKHEHSSKEEPHSDGETDVYRGEDDKT